MHQTVASRPQVSGLAERCNQSTIQRLRFHGIPSNNERDVDIFLAEIEFQNLTSNSRQLSPSDNDEGNTPHFPLKFPRMTSHAHEPLTLCAYMHRAEGTFDSAGAMLAEERRRQMHVVLQMERHVRVPLGGEALVGAGTRISTQGELDVVWCGPYNVLEVLNKGENVKLDNGASFYRLCDSIKLSEAFRQLASTLYILV